MVDEAIKRKPDSEIIIESGSSPSGTYHLGHLRELVTCDAILLELRRRGRQARHIAYVDDLDALRKIPVNVPSDYEKYLGVSLCDIPAPDDGQRSYADYFLQGFIDANAALNIDVEYIRTHKKYQEGFFVPAIERSLENADKIRPILEKVSGHKLGEQWSPIQINEEGYLKKRRFLGINTRSKTISYEDKDGQTKSTGYSKGEVKLDWRIDWPARWWLIGVAVEPFGRDHATKGGSYDTGAALSETVFGSKPPLPVPYDFVNLAGDTKKMSASKGTGLEASEAVQALPPEIFRFFMLRFPPQKRLYFDPVNVSKLIDDYAELLAKADKTDGEKQLLEICSVGADSTVSSIPFSHLVESYQAALRDPDKTLEILSRSEYHEAADREAETIKKELSFIDGWLEKWAPDDIKFDVVEKIDQSKFSSTERNYLSRLADVVEKMPADTDGETLHKAIYAFKDSDGFTPQQLFNPLYKALIGKTSGPRAGWFLAMLPRDWLLKRLRLEA